MTKAVFLLDRKEMEELLTLAAGVPIRLMEGRSRAPLAQRREPLARRRVKGLEGPAECQICGKRFSTGRGLGGHMAKQHPAGRRNGRPRR